MQRPAIPEDERERLAELRALGLLDTAPEERFDRVTRLAQRIFSVPIALVSLVDEDRQWFKSRQGLDATETPREVSFCGHAILEEALFQVPDAAADDRFADNPLVEGEPDIRFYAGIPFKGPGGSTLGTLCLIDREPRELGKTEALILQDLADVIEQELADRHEATVDALTGLSNRRGFEILARKVLSVSRRLERDASLVFLDLDDFKVINDEYGHAAGDTALRAFAGLLRESFRESDVIARLGGDEFAVLLAATADVAASVARLQDGLAEWNASTDGPSLSVSVGQAQFDHRTPVPLDELMSVADEAMYVDKAATD